LQFEIKRSVRYQRPLSLAFMDVDNFKSINDTLGHAAGDRVLAAVSGAISECVRASDFIGRLGGDEFAVLLVETDAAAAKKIAEKIRAHIAAAHLKETKTAITVSVGVVTCDCALAMSDDFLREADRLMYQVKQSGKDGVRAAILSSTAKSRRAYSRTSCVNTNPNEPSEM
jgi:diguanylate cyclase (GGDEF)-like protein